MSSQHTLELGHEGARGELLSPRERQAVITVAAGRGPQRQRALALLALDQGVTLAEADDLSGLSRERVRYWRDQFRQRGMSVFPAALLNGNASSGPSKTGSRKWSTPKAVEAPRGDAGDKTKQKGKSESAKRAGKGKKGKVGKGKPAPKKGKKSGKKRNTKKKKSKKQTRKARKKRNTKEKKAKKRNTRKTKRAKQAKAVKGSRKQTSAGKNP